MEPDSETPDLIEEIDSPKSALIQGCTGSLRKNLEADE